MKTDYRRHIPQQEMVVMDNQIVDQMQYKLSSQQLKVLRCMIKTIKPTDSEMTVYTFNIPNFCKLLGIDEKSGANYSYIKKELNAIDYMSQWIKHDGCLERFKWFDILKIKPASGTIEYSFSRSIAPYLFQLVKRSKGYTQYYFDDIAAIKSKYGIRLYELLKMHSGKEHDFYQVGIENLKTIIDADSDSYNRFANLRARVLDPAIEEINRVTFIKVKYTPIRAKGSRSYTSIRFDIEEPTETEMEEREITKRAALGLELND